MDAMIFLIFFILTFSFSLGFDLRGSRPDNFDLLRRGMIRRTPDPDSDDPNIVFGAFTELTAGIQYPEFYRQHGTVASIEDRLEIREHRHVTLTPDQLADMVPSPATPVFDTPAPTRRQHPWTDEQLRNAEPEPPIEVYYQGRRVLVPRSYLR